MEATPHLVLRVLSEAGDPAAWDNAPACAPLHACADVRGAPCPPARHQTGCRLPLCSSGKRASHRSAGKSVSVTRVSLRSSGTLGPERGCNSQGARSQLWGRGAFCCFPAVPRAGPQSHVGAGQRESHAQTPKGPSAGFAHPRFSKQPRWEARAPPCGTQNAKDQSRWPGWQPVPQVGTRLPSSEKCRRKCCGGKKKADKCSAGQVLYVCALKTKPTGDESVGR